MAASQGFLQCVERLLTAGADINQQNKVSNLAIRIHHLLLLLDANHQCWCCLQFGLTPLHVAIQKGHADVVQLLLSSGAKPRSTHTRVSRLLLLTLLQPPYSRLTFSNFCIRYDNASFLICFSNIQGLREFIVPSKLRKNPVMLEVLGAERKVIHLEQPSDQNPKVLPLIFPPSPSLINNPSSSNLLTFLVPWSPATE